MKSFFSYIDLRQFSRTKKIHFFINIAVGIFIAIFFHFIEHTDWGEWNINKVFDFLIAREAANSARAMESLTARRDISLADEIVFAEIDQKTFTKWGSPLITPCFLPILRFKVPGQEPIQQSESLMLVDKKTLHSQFGYGVIKYKFYLDKYIFSP